jgi:predicted ArsR family transcriptional regulator
MTVENLSETQRAIVYSLKREGRTTMAQLADQLNMSNEAVRQHLIQLEREGWVEKYSGREQKQGAGRPTLHYELTSRGDHLFPKHYDALTVEVLDTLADQLGPAAVQTILSNMAEKRIREWEPRLLGLSLTERLDRLKQLYLIDDSFMEIEREGKELRLIERNCPFLNVAMRRPILCSVSVSVLTNLLGYRVVRDKKFQNGNGCCSFRILLDQPVESSQKRFYLETQ